MLVGCTQILHKKTSIRMGRAAYELLFTYIQSEALWSIMATCNQHLKFDVRSKLTAPPPGTDALLLKASGDEELRINKDPVQLGMLRGGLEDRLLNRYADSVHEVRPHMHNADANRDVIHCLRCVRGCSKLRQTASSNQSI